MSKREIRKEYKERRLMGGVYIIVNSESGKYLLDHTSNLAGIQNRFAFAVTTGSTIHLKLKSDWEAQGSGTFTLKVLEELEQRPGQSEAEFQSDLLTLEQLWRAQLDPVLAY